ncbi:hypothetical protein E4L96_14090 [Massilia arenosa]|uniref:Uncharacterized protein n=1 Tax=Zemynaea arenosa TaxID=2561931 RepID=A0A4Y9S885_9BURK|nr:hypothetical protein [Massilia arenosa]TFW17726.1 hypothetical protein E4L96_14090 [Massilia arenosa]
MRRTQILASAALLLAGCGGGGSSHTDTGPGPSGPPPVMTDSFIATVTTLTGVQPDDTEPAALNGESPAAPDDTEPVAVTP